MQGSSVRAKHVGRDLMAGLKNIFGGELKGYTELLQESRDEAIDRMKEQAQQLGANAIVNVRFSTSSVAAGAAEIYVYGTAVKVSQMLSKFLIFITLLGLGYFFGKKAEADHLKSIISREKQFASLPTNTYLKNYQNPNVQEARLAQGAVVISIDFFKKTIASIIMVMGYGIIAVPTGIVSAEMIQVGKEKKEPTPTNTQACPSCSKESHADDAEFCKFCGEKL